MMDPVFFRRLSVGLLGFWFLLATTMPTSAITTSPPSSLPTLLAANSPTSSADQPRIVAFGDSLTAGLGVGITESYPAQLQRRLDDAGLRYRVINAGVSGETTAGGVRRVAWVLKSQPTIVILELGANDGLRGLSPDETQANLERIIQRLRQAGVTVVLAGMKLPPNYGKDYVARFEGVYPALAEKYNLMLIPFFLDGVVASVSLNQADGIHPTGKGYEVIVEKLFQRLKPLLKHEPPRPTNEDARK